MYHGWLTSIHVGAILKGSVEERILASPVCDREAIEEVPVQPISSRVSSRHHEIASSGRDGIVSKAVARFKP